jgi:predicted nucleic acid-binding OB-fold protein
MQPSAEVPDFSGAWTIRVLDSNPQGVSPGVSHAITEQGLYLIRYRGGEQGESIVVNDGEGIVGMLRYSDLSVPVQSEFSTILKEIILANPEVFLMFYNRGGPINRKMHTFQLLPGIGPSTAQEMVRKRGSGWKDFSAVSEDCGIDAAEYLANRLNEELQDPGMLPSIVSMLVRAR